MIKTQYEIGENGNFLINPKGTAENILFTFSHYKHEKKEHILSLSYPNNQIPKEIKFPTIEIADSIIIVCNSDSVSHKFLVKITFSDKNSTLSMCTIGKNNYPEHISKSIRSGIEIAVRRK